jgi:hypothetical protein
VEKYEVTVDEVDVTTAASQQGSSLINIDLGDLMQ